MEAKKDELIEVLLEIAKTTDALRNRQQDFLNILAEMSSLMNLVSRTTEETNVVVKTLRDLRFTEGLNAAMRTFSPDEEVQ